MYLKGMFNTRNRNRKNKGLVSDRLVKLIYLAEISVTVIERKMEIQNREGLQSILDFRKNRLERLKNLLMEIL